MTSALDAAPTYAPAILSLGSVGYQRGRPARGRRLFLFLTDLPAKTPAHALIIERTGDSLIQHGRYADGLELYRSAVARFPRVAVFHQGVGCCAGHEERHDEAIAASRAALALDRPDQRRGRQVRRLFIVITYDIYRLRMRSTIREYLTPDGRGPFRDWLDTHHGKAK